MTIHVDHIPDVLAVPVQSVVQVDREIWCYVQGENDIERRDVTLGRSNEKFVHVRDGLSEGDRVVLNPMDIFDEQQQETPNEISPEAGAPELSESLQAAAQAAAKAAASPQVPANQPAQGGPGTQGRAPGTRTPATGARARPPRAAESQPGKTGPVASGGG